MTASEIVENGSNTSDTNVLVTMPTQQKIPESPECSTVVTMPLNSLQRDSLSSDDNSDESSLDQSQRSSQAVGSMHPFRNAKRSLADRVASITSSSTQVPNDAKEVDDLLSKEMYNLTFADRNAISEEIHGVRCLAPEETPDLLRRSLVELQQHLDLMPFKPSYDKAQAFARDPEFSKTSYVNTVDFRLHFVRCRWERHAEKSKENSLHIVSATTG